MPFVKQDKDGWSTGFYADNAKNIPEGAQRISETEHKILAKNHSTAKFENGKILTGLERYPKSAKQQRREANKVALDNDTTLNLIKAMTPDEAYTTVMDSNPAEFKKIMASMAKYIAAQYNEDN